MEQPEQGADADFATKLANVRACTLCEGLPLGPNPILQVDQRARILIAGQAPGRITHHKGIPFDDPSGDRLRDWLGVDRETFYDDPRIAIIPLGFCFPGTGKGGDLPPRPECAPAWRSKLLGALGSLELTLIIGRYAIDWHQSSLSKTTVTDAVRNADNLWPKAMILPHPSPRNNRWLKTNPWFENERLPKLKAQVETILADQDSCSPSAPMAQI